MDVMGDEESEVDKTEAEVTEVRVFVAAPCQTSSRTSAMLLRSLYLTFIPLLVAIPIPNGQLGSFLIVLFKVWLFGKSF